MKFRRLFPLAAVFVAGLLAGRLIWVPGKDQREGSDKPEPGLVGAPTALTKPGRGERVGLAALLKASKTDSDELALAQRYGALAGLGVEELESLLAEIALADDRTLRGDREKLESAVILRLMEISPEQVWVALSKMRLGDTEERLAGRKGKWVHRVFGKLATDDLEAGMRLVETMDDYRVYAIAALLDDAETDNFLELVTWAKSVDPEFARFDDAVTDFARKDGYSYYFPDNRIFSRWAQSDPEAAKAYVMGLQGREERLKALSGVAEGLVLTDPDAAVAFINSLDKSEERSAAWYRAIGVMASSRPADAARLYDQLPDGRIKISALNALSNRWIRSDREEATAWLESLPGGRMRERAYRAAADGLEREDPAAAIVLANQLAGVGQRTGMLHEIVRGWIRNDVGGAIAWIGAHDDATLRSDLMEVALPNYAARDYSAAAALYDRLEAAGEADGLADAAAGIARNMESHDPERAFEWARGLDDPAAREAAVGAVVTDISYDDPHRARALIESGADVGGEALGRVAQSLIAGDPAAGFAWASERLDDEQMWSATTRALYRIANRSPEEASQQLEAAAEYLEPETWERLDNQAEMIAAAWGQHDLRAALAWTESLPDGEVRFSATMPLIEQWVFSDPMAASQWIAELPPGGIRHQGSVQLARAIRDDDPESAFLWSQGLSDGYRLDLMGESLETWAEIDPDAARAALGAADVSEEERVALLGAMEGDQ